MEQPTSWVYFIQEGTDGPIKIGYTAANPKGRLAALQTGNANPLRIVTWAPGSLDDEKALHVRFGHLRMQGEWFRPAVELLTFIAGVQWSQRAADPLPEDEPTVFGLTRDQMEAIRYYILLADNNVYNVDDDQPTAELTFCVQRLHAYHVAGASFGTETRAAMRNPPWAAARLVYMAQEDDLADMEVDAANAAEKMLARIHASLPPGDEPNVATAEARS